MLRGGNDDGCDSRLGAYPGEDDIGAGPFSYEHIISSGLFAPSPLTDHRTTASLIALPLASFACALKRITSPVRAVVVRGSIATLRTELLTTSIVKAPLAPSAFARSFAFPGATPVTSPAAFYDRDRRALRRPRKGHVLARIAV